MSQKPDTEKPIAVRVRPLSPEEVPDLRALWLSFMTFHADFGPDYAFEPDAWPLVQRRFVHAALDNEHLLLGAFLGTELVGYLFAFIFANYPGYLPAKIGFVNDLFVREDQRRRGIGRSLLAHAEDWFRAQKISFFQLSVAYNNQTALAFWRSCGYRPYSIGMIKRNSFGPDANS